MNVRDRLDPALALLQRLPPLRQVDLAHSRQVTRLALGLFDELAQPLALESRGRDLLAVAAFWHDTGQAICEQAHHKHSYALIMAQDVPGFGPQDRQEIACIARYHRKALPSPRHEGFAALQEPAGERVRRLAALLRIADGLDYSHRSLVRRAHMLLSPGAATLLVYADPTAAQEIERARRKADLFQQVFDRRIELRHEE